MFLHLDLHTFCTLYGGDIHWQLQLKSQIETQLLFLQGVISHVI